MDKKTVKLIEPNDIDDVQLPELTQWQNLFQRPTSLRELDPDASQELNDVEATFLSLGDLAYLDQITETEITDEAITTPKLRAGSIDASKIQAGAITSIKIDADAINGKTIIGAEIKTSTSGDRIEMENDRIDAYDSSDDLRLRLDDGYLKIYDSGSYVGQIGGENGAMSLEAEDNIAILADNNVNLQSDSIIIDGFDDIVLRRGQTLVMGVDSSGVDFFTDVTFEDNVTFDGDIDMNDNNLDDVGDINIDNGSLTIDDGFVNLATMSGATADARSDDQDGSIYYRTGNDEIRVKINGSWRTITTS